MRRRFLLLALFLTAPAIARVSTGVSSERSNYDWIDRLESYRCAYSTYRAMLPQTYADLRSAIDVGEAPPDDEENRQARCRIPRWLRRERDLMLRPQQPNSATAALLLLKDDSVPLDGIEAEATPSFALRDNRPYFNGANLQLEFQANAEAGKEEYGLALSATPGFVAGLDNYTSLRGKLYLQEAYAKVGYKWAELQFGKVAPRFGSTAHGGLLLAGAGTPVTMLRLGIRPHILGTPFGFLGPFTFETWVSDTSESALVDESRLWAIALGFRPLTWLELAFLELYQFGGKGAPTPQVGDVLKMLAYWSDADLDTKRQRHFASHVSLWGPGHAFKLYFQLMFDSLGEAGRWFADDISPLVGLWFPDLGGLEIRTEYVRTTPEAYRHPFWRQGLTYKRSPLGHPIGPNGEALYLDLGFPRWNDIHPTLGFAYERRGREPRAAAVVPETRYGVSLGLRKRWLKTELMGVARYTRVEAQKYVSGVDADLMAGWVALRYSFY